MVHNVKKAPLQELLELYNWSDSDTHKAACLEVYRRIKEAFDFLDEPKPDEYREMAPKLALDILLNGG